MDLIRISTTAHILNFLPEYVAADRGLFAARDLEVRITVRDPWDGVLDDLADGSADLVLSGMFVPAMYAGRGRDLVVVGQLNGRLPSGLVTREPVPDFRWSWLTGRTLLAPGATGAGPNEFAIGLMREAGVDPAGTRFVRDFPKSVMTELFTAGLGDALLIDLATATGLQDAGTGTVSCDLAQSGGAMPNSVYYLNRDTLDGRRDVIERFLAALSEGMAQTTGSAPAELDDVLTRHWPDTHPDVLHDGVARMIESGLWSGVRVEREACDRWVRMLHQAGLVQEPVPFDDLVDTKALDAIE
ncbi:ABC transporter substrate-binding protein [Amycolatopsis jejuensis]|uniref:ABC transporter substrate-binding protein n=1 Tax=Amycolatopsis jejuensis TaxID=330084 RepID=UPI00068CFE06|nr:ABC transporter substrate-binding protein [Amycolatopsis jejuensis]